MKYRKKRSQQKSRMPGHSHAGEGNHECVDCEPGYAEPYVPCGCPEPVPQAQYPSPTGPLPPLEQAQLDHCIHEVNEFLQAIGSPSDPDNTRALQLRFRKLRKQVVHVQVQCGTQCEESGVLLDAGLDFLLLEQEAGKLVIPFTAICSVGHEGDHAHSKPLALGEYPSRHHEHELCHISDRLRRQLVLCFSDVVAGNPQLINIFFGLPLSHYLQGFLNAAVAVRTEEASFTGVLKEVEEAALVVETEGGAEHVSFEELCFLRL